MIKRRRLILIGIIVFLALIGLGSIFMINMGDIFTVRESLGYFLMTIVLGITLMTGSLQISNAIDKKISWKKEPIRRLFMGLLALFFFHSLDIIVVNYVFYHLFFNSFSDKFFRGENQTMVLVQINITLFISILFHVQSFVVAWKEKAVNEEKLKGENILSQYETLRNQVNPHFLFNSLNALTNLVKTDQEMAVKFIKQLSEVYRYVLEVMDKESVELKTEIKFLKSYIFLQQIRFGDNLKVNINFPEDKHIIIPPLTLQILVENAIKHNVISDEQPLEINLYLENDGLMVIANNLQRKRIIGAKTGFGLKNIMARYQYLFDKEINIVNDNNHFIVKLPVVEQEKR